MADDTQIINGFYKGVPITIDAASISGGRKTSIKQFPNRDTQNVEDLGLMPRSYKLDIIISDKVEQDYFTYRDTLLAALESRGTGELIHPLYGRIENVAVTTFDFNEQYSQFGETIVSVNFEVSTNQGVPVTSGNVVTEIEGDNAAVVDAVDDDIGENFSITEAFTENFGAAVDKVNEIIDETIEATSFIGETAATLNEFASQIGELSANINSLVTQPLALAQSITSLFQSMGGLYASARATFSTFVNFFGFGDIDIPFKQDTAGRIERQRNNDVLNGAVNAMALGYAYLSVSRLEFETVADVDAVASQLDGQFERVMNGGASDEVKQNVIDIRINVLDLLDQARISASQLIEVQTTPTTTRLLSFAYYGTDEQGGEIAELNNIADVSFVEGNVTVLTS